MNSHDTAEPDEGPIVELSALGPVQPPPGFIHSVVDRPPQRAAVAIAVACGLTVVGIMAFVAGGVADHRIVPSVDHFNALHVAHSTGALEPQLDAKDTVADLPDDFEPARVGWDEETVARQEVYLRGSEPISVFVQRGPLDRDGLVGAEPIEGAPMEAWRIGDEVVVASDDRVLTMVGIHDEDIDAVLAQLPAPIEGFEARLRRLAADLSAQLGFAELR